jgi:protein tyrosine/serine phosphatase
MRRLNLLLQATLLGGLSVVDSFSSPCRFTKNLQAHSLAVSSLKDDAVDSQEEDQEFQDEIKALCKERNLPLVKVKNCRDLHSTKNSPVKEGRLFRTGRLGDATDEDQKLLFDELGIKTLVDLRSPTELKDDPALNAHLFSDFTDLVWIENGRGRDGCIRKLGADESPIKRKRFRRNKQTAKEEDDDEFCDYDCDDPTSLPAGTFLEKKESNGRKERHFVSLMNEFKYVRGTVSKLPKRTIAKSILKSPGAVLSKRIWNSLKKPFIEEINDGGLSMLNELLLRFGAPGIKYVLDLCADRTRHPVAFYCTAGKDRTGTIAAIILSLLGVGQQDIVEDYSLSANVYAEMNDHQAMVGALSQRSLDPKTFLGAPPEVMADTLLSIEENYGSVEGYCDWIGFGPEQREKLRKALLED